MFDYDKAEENALRKTFSSYRFAYDGSIRQKYRIINDGLWKSFENNEVTKEELQVSRFSRLFEKIGIKCDAGQFNSKYLMTLGNESHLLNGAKEICKYLFDKQKQLYIITNGMSKTQRARIVNSEIKDYFMNVFISEEIGFQKPNKSYFEAVLSDLGTDKTEEILIVGDSLSSDIKGGGNIGMDTCWFNPSNAINTTDILPTYEIRELKEITRFS